MLPPYFMLIGSCFAWCSNGVCQIIEAEGVIDPLINVLKQPKIPEILMEKVIHHVTSSLSTNLLGNDSSLS